MNIDQVFHVCLMVLSTRRRGSRHLAISMSTMKKQAKRTLLWNMNFLDNPGIGGCLHRTIQRSLAAQATGRTPGKPGRPALSTISKVTSLNVQSPQQGAVYHTFKRCGSLFTRPSNTSRVTSCAQGNTYESQTRILKRPAAIQRFALLEVCAYPGSALSKAFASEGHSAVRIAHRKHNDGPVKSGPEPVLLG